MTIESRWPVLAEPGSLKKITGTLRGKLPASPHALADMLDSAAQRAAAEAGCSIVGVAGDAYEGEAEEVYEASVLNTETVPNPANRRKTITRQVQAVEKRTRKVPTLSRDYWAAPQA